MAIIQNSAIIQKLVDELELSPSLEKIPTELAEKILPVFQVNSEQITIKTPTANVVRGVTQTIGGNVSDLIYTVPSTGKFYLTNVTLSASNTYNDAVGYSIHITIDGVLQNILLLPTYSSAAYGTSDPHPTITLNLQNPVLLDKASTIDIVRSTAVDNTSAGTIVGYTEAD